MSDIRSILGYQKGSPWENAPYNLIKTPQGKITMANTTKKLKAFDAKTGKFLSDLIPGNEYQFRTDNILEVPFYQNGGQTPVELKMQGKQSPFNFTPNTTCPHGYYWSSIENQCKPVSNNNQTTVPQQSNQPQNYTWQNIPPISGNTPSIPVNPDASTPVPNIPGFKEFLKKKQMGLPTNDMKTTGNEGTSSNPMGITNTPTTVSNSLVAPSSTPAGITTGPDMQPKKKPNTPYLNGLETISALNMAFSAFANHVEEGRQRAWNQKQMAGNFNGTYSNATNDYGVDPYEQTGQFRQQFQKGGRTPIVVDNPNDPRLRAYNDSLKLYRAGENWKKYVTEHPYTSAGTKNDREFFFKNEASIKGVLPNAKPISTEIINNSTVNNFKKPVQPVVYQKQQSNKAYDQKYPPIYINNPKDPRIGLYTEKGNQYVYQTPPKPVEQPEKIFPAPAKGQSKPAQIIVSNPYTELEPNGQPVYGPSNGLVGYMTAKGFAPTTMRNHLNKVNQADIDLLNNPEALQKYVSSTPRFQRGGQFNIIDYLYGNDDDNSILDKKEKAKTTKKQSSRITEDNIDQLSLLGLSPEDILNETEVGSVKKASNNSSSFRTFATPEEGRQALENQLELYKTGKTRVGLNPGSSLYEAMSKYAPSSDNNNPKAYAEFIAKSIGISPHTPIAAIDTKKWANAITKMEGNKKGNNPGNLKKFQEGGTYNVDLSTLLDLQKRGIKFKML